MTARTQALIRDIASLFIKYSIADWEPVIAQFEGRESPTTIAAVVRSLALAAATETAAAKPISASRKKAKPTPKPQKIHEPTPLSKTRAAILEPVREALRARALLPSAADLKSAYHAIGIKTPQPGRRDMVAEAIVRHLDGLSEERFDQAMTIITQQTRAPNLGGDAYGRWFDIILKQPGSSAGTDE